ncbi:MAG TPA: phage terminase small subunit P27 family [Geminicoccus sp.]|jgi:P27 family predicted phage terminase small subunit|uniref:phage terminase small subunit P27 family n=1 Tax=Geminicoccus sp. TaxID=2024832 RepID=UPI002E2F3D1E|nr:phage terminase small subunit P27 family [Geminicoccus sp.]HEX2524822.1 phage terminase small subunit P27 family [Geminicoccus sp.]
MRGRKPKLKVIEGGLTQGRCPPAPAWLTAQAKAEWRRAAPEIHGRKLLTPDTLATLESYCIVAGLVRELEEVMGRDGRMIETEDGPKPHPAFKMQSAAMREARLLATELGFMPHRRAAKTQEESKSDDWADDLLA